MERAAFLQRLRQRLDRAPAEPGGVPNIPHPLEKVDDIPRPSYKADLSDPIAAFVASAVRTKANVRQLSSIDDLGSMLDEIVAAHGIETAVVSADPEVALATASLESRAIDVSSFSIDAAARADLGVTGAAYGLAATGTLVLHSGRAGARSAGLLPPVHLALLHERNVITDASALFRHLPERFPDGLPSQLILATGPSRSADIEQILTIGVHGPGTVWFGLLGPDFDHP